VPVGEWVLQSVCAQIIAWQAMGIATPSVAVNVSARQFQQQNLKSFIGLITSSGVDARLIELELTESLLMKQGDEAERTLLALKAAGVRLSLDDFGTGYSSLAYLKRFPLDEIKIDRTFIRDLVADPEDAEITLAIINLAHSLKLKVVAEGVETEAQLAFLRAHGCDEMQGYYFSPPLPVTECTRLLAAPRNLRVAELNEGPQEQPAVLLVEHDSRDLEHLRCALAPAGFHILHVSNAKAAFEILARRRVSIVISDFHTPGMSGIELLASVRQLYPDTIRIIAASEGDVALVTEAVNKAGIHRYLRKDWDAEQLRVEVRAALLRSGGALIATASL